MRRTDLGIGKCHDPGPGYIGSEAWVFNPLASPVQTNLSKKHDPVRYGNRILSPLETVRVAHSRDSFIASAPRRDFAAGPYLPHPAGSIS